MLRIESKFRNIIALAFITTLLTACGGGGGSDTSGTNPPGGSNPPPAPGARNISLSWVAPSTRTDGSPASLSEISGYKIYVGTTSGSYDPAIDVGNTTSYTLTNKSPDTYYITIAAYDSTPQDGIPSTESVVTVN